MEQDKENTNLLDSVMQHGLQKKCVRLRTFETEFTGSIITERSRRGTFVSYKEPSIRT